MNVITYQPMFGMLVSFVEILLIVFVLIVVPLTIAGIILLVIWLTRRNRQKPPTPSASTKRLCPQCGKEMSPDAPQGLCPACLMQVALGTQGAGNTPRSETEKTPPPTPAELAARFPQLEILELLGHGGMGAVYKARQKHLDRLVALKVLPAHSASDAGFTERFNREARALAKLSHPNIVGVYEYGQSDGVPFFIMEYVDGLNLRQVQQTGKLEPREALKIIPQICEALQFAHDEGIVHRDIKPENVLLDKKGRVKIADFGLARILGREPSVFRLTGARDIMGTPHYMAPEQIEKPQTVDHRADIYSLGVVFYELLTGELPLGRFAPPSQKVQVDVRLDDVVLRTLEKEPGRRYQHASEVKTHVETIASHPRVATNQPRWIWALLAVVLLPLIIGFVLMGLYRISSKSRPLEEPTALFAPVSDPSLGDSSFRLISTLTKPRHVALGVFQFIDERHSVAIRIPQLGFYLASPEKSDALSARLTWALERITEGQGAWSVRLNGEKDSHHFTQLIRLAGDKPFFTSYAVASDPSHGPLLSLDPATTTWNAVRPERSFWVGPGEWSKREWNTLTLFEARDAQKRIVGRLQIKLLVCPLPPDANTDWSAPLFRLGDWEQDENLKPLIGALPETSTAPMVRPVAELEFRLVAAPGDTTPADELTDPNDRTGQTKLRVLKEVVLDSSAITSARLETEESPNAKNISVTLRKDAAKKIADVTRANLNRRLAIVWRGRLLSAPTIMSPITGPAISITGNLSDAELMVLVNLLNFNAAAEKPSPETIIERTITLAEVSPGGLAFVDLEKAELLPPPFQLQVDLTDPQIIKHHARIDEWISASGVDLVLYLKTNDWRFSALGTRMYYASGDAPFLDTTSVTNANALIGKELLGWEVYPVYGAGVSAYPVTANYAFKTRTGSMGLMELVGFTNNGNGIKIRYKIVQSQLPSPPRTVSPVSPEEQRIFDEVLRTRAQGRLAKAEEELSDLRTKYTDTHPVVQNKRHEIETLRRQLQPPSKP